MKGLLASSRFSTHTSSSKQLHKHKKNKKLQQYKSQEIIEHEEDGLGGRGHMSGYFGSGINPIDISFIGF